MIKFSMANFLMDQRSTGSYVAWIKCPYPVMTGSSVDWITCRWIKCRAALNIYESAVFQDLSA